MAERLLRLLEYDPLTGLFTWKYQPKRGISAGTPAGYKHSQGYTSIGLGCYQFFAHRLAWLFSYGAWPSKHIDHINGDKKDNRIANLRDVSRTVNLQNMRAPRRSSRTGLLGVGIYKDGRFIAKIRLNNKQRHLGIFATAEEASEAYLAAKRKWHEGCTI